jgi:hypothetical protein
VPLPLAASVTGNPPLNATTIGTGVGAAMRC